MSENFLADREKLTEFLRANGLAPKKKIGQNFLVDSEILAQIVSAADLHSADFVVEVGAGAGVLTRELAARAGQVVALEFDEQIFPALQKNLADFQNVELQNLDVRKFTPPSQNFKLVANIPYHLSTAILRQFFVAADTRPEVAVLLVQKEVAEKICDPRGGLTSWQVRVFGEAEIVCPVSKNSFLPPPAVDSAVLKISRREKFLVSDSELPQFFEILEAGFRAPRKKIAGSLAAGLPFKKSVASEIVAISEIDSDLRPADLEIQDWLALLVAYKKLKN